MDPSKFPSAPQPGWSTDEKSAQVHMNQPAPPPYQDYPQYPIQGYPGQGYPPHPQGYGAQPQPGVAPYGQQPYPMGAGMPPPGQPGSAITVQPAVYMHRVPLVNPVNDYLGYSIFTLLCCCMPLGVAALIYSISTRDANMAGDRLGAERNSKTARILNHVGLGIGLSFLIISIIYVGVVMSAGF